MKKPKKTQKRKTTAERILLHELSNDIDRIAKTPWVRSLNEGKQYICQYCGQPVQACKVEPGSMCNDMIRKGTLGQMLEDAIDDPVKSGYGVCASCGKKISTATLKKNPFTELCSNCRKALSKTTKVIKKACR